MLYQRTVYVTKFRMKLSVEDEHEVSAKMVGMNVTVQQAECEVSIIAGMHG